MIEPPIEPPERKNQDAINRICDMHEAKREIGVFLEDYKCFFREEITNFLADLTVAIWREEEDD